MNTVVKFAKVKDNAVIPSKHIEDAGFDIYACFDEDFILIEPNETKLIPTGIASCCDEDYCILLRERGSTGSKGIGLRAGVLDSGYRGEWFVGLTNHTTHGIYIVKDGVEMAHTSHDLLYPCSKAIAQALVVPVPKVTVEEISYEELQQIESKRGSGKLGSSGK